MKHRVFVYDRGGRNRIAEITHASVVQWNRARDDISTATVTVTMPAPQCSLALANIEPGRHELVIFRGGKRVWEGPVTLLTYSRSSVIIEAKDVWHYTYRSVMQHRYDNSYPNIISAVERIRRIVTAELRRMEVLDPPINVLPYFTPIDGPDTARTSAVRLRFERTVWEEIDDLAAKGGIDYTAVGRKMLVWDTHHALSVARPLVEEDFAADIIVTVYGMDLATFSAVTDGMGRFATIGGTDPYYGLWEVLDTAYQARDGAEPGDKDYTKIPVKEMRAQAKRNLAGHNPTPVVVRIPDNSSLTPEAVEDLFDYLVPGVHFPLRSTSTVRKVEQVQKLDSVRFEETEDGETVLVTLSPAPGVSIFGDDANDGEDVE